MADNRFLTRIAEELAESCRVKQSFTPELKLQIIQLAERMAATLASGGTIYWMGNGGSAADAQHLATELVGKLRHVRRALAAISLTTNASLLTAIANDTAYEEVFARQVEAFVRPGDVLIGLSTSGNSPNVIRALQVGREKKAFTVGWTGASGGRVAEGAELCLRVPSKDTQRIQEAHITIGHILCGIVEDLLEGSCANPSRPSTSSGP
ncbi:MAG: D-sedoheptulose 7-phosphate isomerase [Acidobacteria bacterium]|nr:D-sedoheptulose 7-phosphate isomerase [Acidobacteriota bacterium]